VIVEAVVGLIPLAAIVIWGWDAFLVLMLHLLALVISAAWLVLRMASLSDDALRYFNRKDGTAVPRGARWLYAGFALVTLAVPLVLFAGIITVELRPPGSAPIRSLADFWRVVVVTSGLWLPLGLVAMWEAASSSPMSCCRGSPCGIASRRHAGRSPRPTLRCHASCRPSSMYARSSRCA
jgi:hypothetical protein